MSFRCQSTTLRHFKRVVSCKNHRGATSDPQILYWNKTLSTIREEIQFRLKEVPLLKAKEWPFRRNNSLQSRNLKGI